MITDETKMDPPAVDIEPNMDAPVKRLKSEDLKLLGTTLASLFERYASDRSQVELKWLRNLRQYLGIYDPELERLIPNGRSRAYPRLTRVKCISVLSRIMNLMFPGNEKNWTLKASPNAEMSPEDVQVAVEKLQAQQQGDQNEVPLTDELVQMAVQQLADERAHLQEKYIDDQLQEIGGDQTLDYVSLNRSVCKSGIMFGMGLLQGPFVRQHTKASWGLDNGKPAATTSTSFKPQYEYLSVWDYYPDMGAKTLSQGDGYFIRKVMSRAQLRNLAKRDDFFAPQIREYLRLNANGNYTAKTYETTLRTMGVAENANITKGDNSKYEVIIWNGPISGAYLAAAGVEVDAEKHADDFNAEVWMVDGKVIK